ncbi:phage tail tube protein [Rathayibacter sp. Leaf248]|uniref:phage tail tube protein n=1 Tax=Rathayibacter sp. Leaf248 TaxID=2876555 RepID=UPI001E538033|nr:hypothetical protein [Rathayibacter sp. Leaf248]
MTNTAGKVISGKSKVTGGVLTAPAGTTGRTDPKSGVPAGYSANGYVSEDGLSKTENRDVTTIKEWSGLVVKRTQTGFEVEFSFAFLEYLNADAAKAIYGDDAVVVTPATAEHGEQMIVTVSGKESPRLAWIFDMADGDAVISIEVPDAQVTATGDTSYNTSGAALRQVTLTAYFDDELGGFYRELSDDGIKVAA